MMAGYENKTILNNITDVDTLLQLLIKNEAYYLEIASIRANPTPLHKQVDEFRMRLPKYHIGGGGGRGSQHTFIRVVGNSMGKQNNSTFSSKIKRFPPSFLDLPINKSGEHNPHLLGDITPCIPE